MKKNIIKLFFAFTIIGTIFCSCGKSTSKQLHNLQFEKIEIKKTEHLFADNSKPACNLSISVEFVSNANTNGAKDSINTYILAAALENKYQHFQPQDAINDFVKEYIENYRNDLEPMIQKDIDNKIDADQLTAWYSYEQTIEGNIETYKGNLLTYRTYKNEYSGGPHGMYTTEYINLNLSNLQPILLDELFLEDYQETLTNLLWYQLALDNQVNDRNELEEMGYGTTGDLEATQNFYLNENGITFYYNVYEISPYAMGPTQITLSYEMLEYILNYENPLVNELTTIWN